MNDSSSSEGMNFSSSDEDAGGARESYSPPDHHHRMLYRIPGQSPERENRRTALPSHLPYRAGKGGWNLETIVLLERVRRNTVYLSEYHRARFYHFKSFAKYFDLPVLILSSIGASASIGLQPYLPQATISLISCLIGLVVSIITSVKLYLNINDGMAVELRMSKDFYTLGIDLFKMLSLAPKDRGVQAVDYLNAKYAHYAKLVEESNLLKKKFIKDHLAMREPSTSLPQLQTIPEELNYTPTLEGKSLA